MTQTFQKEIQKLQYNNAHFLHLEDTESKALKDEVSVKVIMLTC